MLRVVVDPNVVISAAISPAGVTGRLIRLGLTGHFRIVVCPMLLQEAREREVLSRPKLHRFVNTVAALELLTSIDAAAEQHADPAVIEAISRNRDDDYLVALATELTCRAQNAPRRVRGSVTDASLSSSPACRRSPPHGGPS